MKSKNNTIRLIGRTEFADLPLLGLFNIAAKIDTGAYTSSLHCENIHVQYENLLPVLYFTLQQTGNDEEHHTHLRFEAFTQKKIKNSFGEMEERYVIETLVCIGKKKIHSEISLSNREAMKYPLLIGRKLLKGKFFIDVGQVNINGIQLNNIINQLTQKNNL